MCAGDWAEPPDEGAEREDGGECVHGELDADVVGEVGGHDAGADDCGDQECGAECFGDEFAGEVGGVHACGPGSAVVVDRNSWSVWTALGLMV